ncbi:MAG TPA: putative LPS assembly protein LptD [Bacteroidia bacterium]
MLITVFLFSLVSGTAQTTVKDSLKNRVDTLNQDMIEEEIKYNARDSIRFEVKDQKIYLYGEAVVEFSGRTLQASYIEIDNKNSLVTASGTKDSTGKLVGNPIFKDQENEMRCEKIIYNTKTKKGKIFGVFTQQAEMIIYGEIIKKDSNNVLYIQNAKCIPCEYEDAVFYFRATKAKVMPDDKIVTGPVFVEVAGMQTPVGLPFGYFPNVKNKSKAGIIIPTFGESPDQGFFLQNGGLYLPINSRMDMEIRGDIYSIGSYALFTTNRYLKRYKYNGILNLGYKEIVRGNKEIPFEKNNALGFQRLKNFSVNWVHTQDSKRKPNERFSANVNVQSALNNKYNPESSAHYLTNTFFSNISYGYTFKNSALALNARHNQNTQSRMVEVSFPEVTFNTVRFFPFKNENRSKQNFLDKIGISYTAEAKSFLRAADSVFFKDSTLNKIQYGLRHTVPISTNLNVLKYFTLTPAINLSAVNYMSYSEYHYDSTLYRAVLDTMKGFKTGFDANFSANLTTKLFGDYYFKGKHLKQIRHFIIPTVGINYHPKLDSDKLGFYKMVQTDSMGRTRQYSIFEQGIYGGPLGPEGGNLVYGLNNNIEAKYRQKSDSGFVDKKITLLQNLGINGSYSMSEKEMQWSQISITMRTRVWKNIDLMGGTVLDPYAVNMMGKRINLFYYYDKKLPFRYVSSQLAANAAFNPQLFLKPGQKARGNWNLNLTYNILFMKNYNETIKTPTKPSQQFNFSGNVDVTTKWKVGFSSGYDFTTRKISYTSFNVFRDLRCWEARIDWVPFGPNQRYQVGINLKTSSLRDVKIPKKRNWYDKYTI